jgi:hypothetical protein
MTIELTGDDETKVEAFAGNLFMACLATLEPPTSSSASGSASTRPWPASAP